jgi:cell volume regulation protein A
MGPGVFDHSFELILIAAAALLTLSVVASKASSVLGVPFLILFLGIGMLAGSEGPGGIEFDNYQVAFAVGSMSLALILFDGGLRTSINSIRPVLVVGISLASLGVIVTALITAAFAVLVLKLEFAEALLLGAIVSSTDAAAVFTILRSRRLALRGRLKQVLEFEAGSNDPMAIFLTMAVLAVTAGQMNADLQLASMFFLQAALGLGAGWIGGMAMRWLTNRIGLEYEGLYGVLILGLATLLFAGTTALGGSGFLAVYIAGLLLGNSNFIHKMSVLRFHDGIAWIAQISLFLALGLLVFPSRLMGVWQEGLALAVFLMVVARPLSVLIAAPFSRFSLPERAFISWVGLRGAAPIILATLPWIAGIPRAEYLFELVFFVVLTSVIVQGISVPPVARALRLTDPLAADVGDDAALQLLPAGFLIVDIEVLPNSNAVDQKLVSLKLPPGVVLTSLQRDGGGLVPRGDTVFKGGDRIRAFARASNVGTLSETFGVAKIAGQ